MNAHWFYYVVKITGWVALKLFFGSVKLIGRDRIPKDGAVILAPNHQSAFMDAVLSGLYIQRPVSFLTRSDVFNRWSKPILNSLNMIPIYRIRDGIEKLSMNEAIFETCYNLLAEKKTLLIFPEGNHGMAHYLRPLAKGTSRIALDARERIDKHTKIYIVPLGINYFSHLRPLAKVLVHYGEPIDLSDYVPLYEEHKQKAYNQLREDIAEAMKKVLILPEKEDNYEEKRDWIFQPKHEHLSFEQLREMGESGDIKKRNKKKKGIIRTTLILFFSLFNAPPLLALRKVLSGIKDKVFYVSIKYLAGGVMLTVWWIIAYVIGAVWIGWEAGLLFAAVGIITLFARQSLIRY